jgi:hypothetical protein
VTLQRTGEITRLDLGVSQIARRDRYGVPHLRQLSLRGWSRFELLQIGPMELEGLVDLSLFERNLAQQIVGGTELQAKVGVGG